MTPFHPSANAIDSSIGHISFGEEDEKPLLRVLFYPNGKKREFDYDELGRLRGIDHGDGTFWLRSEDGAWLVLSEERPPEILLLNLKLNQDSGDLRYETETMRVTELPSGERICECL